MNEEERHRPLPRLNYSSIVPGSMLFSLVVNVACPYMLYQFLTQRSAPQGNTLLLVALFPLAGLAWGLWKQKGVDLIAVGSLLWVLALLLLGFVDPYIGDSKLIALAHISPFGVLGVVTLFSSFFPRSLLGYVDRYLSTSNEPVALASYEEHWRQQPHYRRALSILNIVWGVGLIVEEIALAIILYTLPQEQRALVTPIIAFALPIVLLVWSIQYKSKYEWKADEEVKETKTALEEDKES